MARGVTEPDDEWQAIALNYTFGTTGNPKGVVLHHRGAYLNACGTARPRRYADRAEVVVYGAQGVNTPTLEDAAVLDPATMAPVAADGATIGEPMLRGNTVMKGYLKNPSASAEAFADGWFHTGDLVVMHPDGYVEIKDRAKDIIISGGENIASLEVEEILYQHPDVMEAAVVARPDDKWGETPQAFVTLKTGATGVTEADIIAWCRVHLAHFKCPRFVTFGPLPKTSTGKIQKFELRQQARGQPQR